MSKEQMLIPTQGVVVQRDGKNVRPKVGEPFPFTAEEVRDIRAAEKETGARILRSPVNEEAKADEVKAKARAAAETKFAEMVKKAEAAEAAAKAKPADAKLAEAADKARAEANDFAAKNGLSVKDADL